MRVLKHIHPKIQQAILEFITNNKPDYKFYGHYFFFVYDYYGR